MMKALTLSILSALIISNLAWLYVFIDNSISSSYIRAGREQDRESISDMMRICNAALKNKSYDGFVRMFESGFDKDVIKKKKDAIFLNSLVFIFDDDLLVEIKLLNHLAKKEYDKLDAR